MCICYSFFIKLETWVISTWKWWTLWWFNCCFFSWILSWFKWWRRPKKSCFDSTSLMEKWRGTKEGTLLGSLLGNILDIILECVLGNFVRLFEGTLLGPLLSKYCWYTVIMTALRAKFIQYLRFISVCKIYMANCFPPECIFF